MQRFLLVSALAFIYVGTLAAQSPAPRSGFVCPTVESPSVAGSAPQTGASGVELRPPHDPLPLHKGNPAAGLYIIENHVDLANWRAMYRSAIAAPYISGAAIMLNWQSLEPAPNRFCWEAFDSQMDDVLRLHKTFTLGLITGGQTPTWVFETAGALRCATSPSTPSSAPPAQPARS